MTVLSCDRLTCLDTISLRRGETPPRGFRSSRHNKTEPAKVKRRAVAARRFGGGCDAQTSQTLAEDYRDPDRQGQDRPLISEDGQSAHMRVDLPRALARMRLRRSRRLLIPTACLIFPGQPGRMSPPPGALSYRWMRRLNLSRIRPQDRKRWIFIQLSLRKPQGLIPLRRSHHNLMLRTAVAA